MQLERGFAKAIKNINKNLSGQTRLIEDVIDELEVYHTLLFFHSICEMINNMKCRARSQHSIHIMSNW